MVEFLESRRAVQLSVSENGQRLFGVLFSAEGKFLKGGSGDRLLMERLSSLAAGQPRISGKAVEELTVGGRKYDIELQRYINCNGAEFAAALKERYGDLEMVSDPAEGRSFTYRELIRLSENLAKALIRSGIGIGDHVAVIMNNCWEQVVVKLALLRIGALEDSLSYHETPERLKELLLKDDCSAVLLKKKIWGHDLTEKFSRFAPEILSGRPEKFQSAELPKLKFLAACGEGACAPAFYSFEELLESGKKTDDSLTTEREAELSALDPGAIMHTSGSSEKPKSVLLSHAQILENALSHQKILKLKTDDRFCMTTPMFHVLGAVGSVMTSLIAGACLVIYEKGIGRPFSDVLKEERVTVLCAVPIIYRRFCEDIRNRNGIGIPEHIRLCITAGAPCSPELLVEIHDMVGARDVVGMYGMTETSSGIASHTPGDPQEVICNTAGHFWEGVEYRIVDPKSGELAGKGKDGEICVRGYMVMQGYYGDPAATGKIIDSEGWVHTGDLGCVREDGRLVLKGRIKDIIIRGAENISPPEVENCLRENRQVDDVAVVGAPDPEYGEMVCAFIVLRQGETSTPEELKQWCRGRIATIKIPKKIVILKTLPVLPSGKTDRKALKALAASS